MSRVSVLPLLLVLLGACSTEASSKGPEVLRVVMADDWANAPVVEEVIAGFEDEHDVRVEVQGSPFSQVADLVRSAEEAGESYDLAHWHAFAAGAAGLARPVDDLWEAHGLRDAEYLPGALQSVTWARTRYGVPLDVNALVLLARREALAAAGVGPEDLADVDELLEVARQLVASEAVPHAMLVGASSWTAYGWIRAFGGELVEVDAETGEPTFSFDDPSTVAALDFRATLVSEGLAPSPFGPDLSSDAVQLFAQEEVALHSGGSWDLPMMARADVEAHEVVVLPLPRGEGDTGTVLGGSSLFVPRGAAAPELAFELALHLTEDDVALRLVEEEGRLPARVRVFDDDRFPQSPDLEAFVDELPEADVMPLIAYPEVSEAFSQAVEDVLAGRRGAAEAMGEVQGLAQRWTEQQG